MYMIFDRIDAKLKKYILFKYLPVDQDPHFLSASSLYYQSHFSAMRAMKSAMMP